MSNVFDTIGKDIKTGVEDAGKGIKDAVEYAIVDPVGFTVKAIAVLKAANADTPAVKTAFEGLFTQANNLEGAISSEIAAKGTNIPEYVTLFNEAKALIDYIKGTFVPVVEKTYADLKAGANTPSPTAAPAAPAATAATAAK